MRKIYWTIAACAAAVATPAMAAVIIGGPFKNYGDCKSRLAWFANSQRWDDIEGWGRMAQYAGYDLYCIKRGEDWFIAYD
ncbi:MAG: hypothetical protein ACO1OD_09270 [Croceibacterium sp.]